MRRWASATLDGWYMAQCRPSSSQGRIIVIVRDMMNEAEASWGRLNLPEGNVIGSHRHGRDLYVIYVRSVLRIPDYEGGNLDPDDAYTLEMQDYYSYDYPMLASAPDGSLWCHIGDRLFVWEQQRCRWAEKARFYAGSLVEVSGSGITFGGHLLYDDNPGVLKTYRFDTGTLIMNNTLQQQ